MIAIQVDEGSVSKEQQNIAQGTGPLSRRDCMKVARHKMPGKVVSRRPSRRVRYDRWPRASHLRGRWNKPGGSNHTVPYGTDHLWRFPRYFMPGYHHVVPTGQIQASRFVDARAQSLTAIRRQLSTPALQYSTTPRSRIRGRSGQ